MPYSPGFKDKLIERESEAVRNNSTMRPLLAYGALAKGISHRLSLARKFGANIVASVSGSGTRAPRLRSEGNSLRSTMCCGPGLPGRALQCPARPLPSISRRFFDFLIKSQTGIRTSLRSSEFGQPRRCRVHQRKSADCGSAAKVGKRANA